MSTTRTHDRSSTTARHPRRALVSLLLALPLTAGTGAAVAQAVGQPAPSAVTTATGDTAAVEAFYDAGYTVADAEQLASIWGLGSWAEAKVAGGRELLAGETLLIVPSGYPGLAQNVSRDEAVDRFLDDGYRYADAQELAQVWSDVPAEDVKVVAGEKLVLGQELPVEPSATPVDQYVAAFFDAGYDYDDAVELAAIWQTPSPYDAKVLAGQKLEAGVDLPVDP